MIVGNIKLRNEHCLLGIIHLPLKQTKASQMDCDLYQLERQPVMSTTDVRVCIAAIP